MLKLEVTVYVQLLCNVHADARLNIRPGDALDRPALFAARAAAVAQNGRLKPASREARVNPGESRPACGTRSEVTPVNGRGRQRARALTAAPV